jgi:hypothetical protein
MLVAGLVLLVASALADSDEDKAFLQAVSKRDLVTEWKSGLQVEIVAKSTRVGPSIRKPGMDDLVRIHYKGTYTNGTEFDSSYSRFKPAHFQPKGVVPGFRDALLMMVPGDHHIVYLPSTIAYGNNPAMGTLSNRALVFHIEMLAVGDGMSLTIADLPYGGTKASCGGEEYDVTITTEKLGIKMGWHGRFNAVEWKAGGFHDNGPQGRKEGLNLLVAINGERLVPEERTVTLELVKNVKSLPRPATLTFARLDHAEAKLPPGNKYAAWKCPLNPEYKHKTEL